MSDLVNSLELDWRELTEGPLTTPAVVGPFDPGDDRKAQFLPGLPALSVEDVALQQGEERLHGGVVGAGPGATHRPDQAVVAKEPDELLGAELATAVGVNQGQTGPAELDGVAHGRHGEGGFHPGVHGV